LEEIASILKKLNLIPEPKYHASKHTFQKENILVFWFTGCQVQKRSGL